MNSKPNMIEIIWHDLGKHLATYGYPGIQSPRLDAFAGEGVQFDNMFCASPGCSPSRAAILTGCYPHTNGMYELAHVGGQYNPDQKTLAHILQKHDYRTLLCGFQHEAYPHVYQTDLTPEQKEAAIKETTGYQELYCRDDVSINAVAPETVRLLKEDLAQSKEPFFLSIGTSEVHRQFKRQHLDTPTEQEIEDVVLPPYIPDTPGARKDYARFVKMIQHSDAQVGLILDALKEAGLEENTIVFFTTDHGAEFCRAKMTLYDPGIAVACLMRWPGHIPPNRKLQGLYSNIDLLPTLLDLADIPIPEYVQGISAAESLEAEKETPTREAIIAEKNWHVVYEPMRCIRTRRYKFIWNKYPGLPHQPSEEHAVAMGIETFNERFSEPTPAEELYDLENDPLEVHNLAQDPQYAQTTRELREQLFAEMERTGDSIRERDIPPYSQRRFPPNSIWHNNGDGSFQIYIPNIETYRKKV